VAAEIVVRYRIDDLVAYVSRMQEPRRMLRALAERRSSELFVTSDIEQLLSERRLALSEALRERLQEDADALGLGVSIRLAAIVGVHPPQAQGVAESFQEQIGAMQQKEAAIEDARRQATAALASVAGSVAQAEQLAAAIRELERMDAPAAGQDGDVAADERRVMQARIDRMLAAARGEAARVVHQAMAYRWEREMLERGKAHRFLAQGQAFARAPRYYMDQAYLDAMTQVLPDARRFIVPGGVGGEGVIRIDLTEAASALGTLLDPER
jgi:membrane protease subunit HflK